MKPTPVTPPASLAQAIASSLSSLATYVESPSSASSFAELRQKLRSVAQLVAALARSRADTAHLQPVMDLQRKVDASGVFDHVAEAADLALAAEFARQGPTGLLAAMLLVPAAQWSGAPALKNVPSGLWVAYTAWLFHTPQGFCAVGQVSAYAAHYLRRLEELVALAEAEPRARQVQTALQMFTARNNSIPLYFSAGSLRQHMELRGRLLAAAARVDRRTDFPAKPRANRRLRVGFVSRHFGSQTETYTTLPTFEQLDPSRFEVRLFAHHDRGTPLEKHAAARAASFTILPAKLDEQLKILRAAALDVVVFGTNVTAVCHEVTLLALHRVAPLQVVNNSSCTTSGLPEIDLYVSGTATEHASAPAHFSERLGLVQGPAHAFNYKVDHQAPSSTWTRAALGLPEDSVVFVSAANFYKIIPEMREDWARLLAAVPGSRLLIHPFNPNWSSSYPIKRFCAEFEAVLAAHGVASERLVVSSLRFRSRSDVAELLKVGDLYLDSFPFAGVNSLVDPLESGVPVITQEGESFRSRMGAALLRNLGLDELIAADAAAYHVLCVRLAGDPVARAALRARITAAMERQPLFLDTLAASDAFGALIEQAYDELAARGRQAFRRDNHPIIGSDVFSTAFRQARGRALLAAGEAGRATDYFLNAIQQDDRNPSLWRDLADAMRHSNRIEEAANCLQTSLQLDARHIPGRQLLADLSENLGDSELHAEAQAMLGTLETPASVAKPQPRVLLYTDDPGHGGVAQYNHSIMSGLAMAGCSVACAQTRAETPLVEAQRELGVTHHWIPYDTKTEFTRTLDDRATARRLIEAAKPDLIVFSDCCPVSNLAARDAALALGVPYIVVVGFVGAYLAERFKGVLGRLALQYARARAVVAVSQENLDLLHARFGLPVALGEVIHYGRPKQFFAPRNDTVRARLRAELDLPVDAVVCFTAARLAAVKGFLYQVVAAKHLVTLAGCEKLHFVWAGDGDQRAALEQAIASAGLARRVHLLGHRWDIADWYDAADIFVLPSDLEGMPLAIMEAMAKGLPVVATAVSGIPEELGDTGQLLPSAAADRSALVNQLIRTLHIWTGNSALRHKLGEAGRARAQAMFRESLMIERTVAVIAAQLSFPSTTAISALTTSPHMNYSEEYNDYWSREDRWGSTSFKNPAAMLQCVTQISGSGSVLDVGCGMGVLVRSLTQIGIAAMGVDIASRPIEENMRLNPENFQLGSILKLPFADGSWETVVSTDCLEHIAEADVPQALLELYRVARRNAYICLATTPDRDKRWHLTIRNRAWWEAQFFAAGFRRHPFDQLLTPYERRESDGWQITMAFEKIPAAAMAQYPLAALEAERDLHNDMTRLSGRRADAHIARYIVARHYLPKEGLVLDGACGLGYGSAVLACGNPGLQVVGIDCSVFAVNYARASYTPLYPNLSFRTADVCDLSAYADGSVGLVVSFETVEHLREPQKFLAEVRRVLKTDGNFICSVPNLWLDEHGKDPNPWHFHVFDFAKITELCGQFLFVRDVINQTAGGGMKLGNAPRRMRRVNLPMTQGDDQAEWWLVAARREPVAADPIRAEGLADTVLVLTHDPKHPLFTSWLDRCPHPVVYETHTGVDYTIPKHVGLVVAADCYLEPRATLLARAMEQGIPTLLLADGILEYRNTFEHPEIAPGAIYQPVRAHKVACLGRSQARILESWGNAAQSEVTGSARFDRYASRKRRARSANDPFRVLVMTAITPYFTEAQHKQVRQSLLDLKQSFANGVSANGVPFTVEWRITKGLQTEINVESVVTDLSGRELADVLERVDAVISTPSTSMVEAMLLGLPVAVLDYTNSPLYLQPAWRITAPGHIVPVLSELFQPPAPKMLFQETVLHDTLECTSPAAPRLLALAEEMLRRGQAARDAGIPLELPARLLPVGGHDAAPAENRFVLPDLFPGHVPLSERNLNLLQVEVGQLRAHVAQLERVRQGPFRPAEVEKIRAHAQLSVKWRALLEAGAAMFALKQPKAAMELLMQSLKVAEASRQSDVILEAVLEVSPHIAAIDAACARVLLDTGLKLAQKMGSAGAVQKATELLAGLPALRRKEG